MLNAIKHRLAFAFLYPEELIEFVDLCTNIFNGLKAHHDEWQFFAIYKTVRKVLLSRNPFDVVDVAFHSFLHPFADIAHNLTRVRP
jgi:hypothetical protein